MGAKKKGGKKKGKKENVLKLLELTGDEKLINDAINQRIIYEKLKIALDEL